MAEKPLVNGSYFHAVKSGMPKWEFVTLIASSFVIIMWIVGLGILISNSKQQPALPRVTSAVSPTPTPNDALAPTPVTLSPSPVPDGWKQYKTSLYAISYPPDWTLKQFTSTNLVEIYNPKIATNPLNNSLIGASLSAQFVLIRVTSSTQTAIQYVNSVQLVCCTGPSPTPGVTNLFQKQSVTLHSVTGEAYTVPATNFLNWNIVFSEKGNLVELSSSITSIVGTKTENTILNTLSLAP